MKKPRLPSKPFSWVFGFILALSLTACGSGGGEGTSPVSATSPDLPLGAIASLPPVSDSGLPTSPPASNSVLPGTIVPGGVVDGGGSGTAGGGTGSTSGGGGGSGTASGPTLLSSNPSNGAINVPLSVVGASNIATATPVSATFSEAMSPASLVSPATAFVLKESVSGQNVAGLVSLNASSTVATFVPTSALLANTQYTAIVAPSASSAAGLPLVATYAWVFTTGSSGSVGQAPIDMGTAAAFVALGGTAIENFGTNERRTQVNGQLGVYQDSSTVVQGFTDSNPVGMGIIATGGIQTNPAMLLVEADLRKAVTEATSRTLNQTRIGITDLALTQIGGGTPGTFPPGLYTSGSATLMLNAGNLTLDAQGNTDAIWVFKADSSFIVGDTRQMMLINGARANQVFWVVGSSVTVGDGVAFKGNILAGSSITLGTPALSGTALEGRAMSASSLTLNYATLYKPTP
jgi:hypothetical protein